MKEKIKRWYVLMHLLCLTMALQAQSVLVKKITVNYQNKFLIEVLKELKNNHTINFSYANETVNLTNRITLNVKEKSISIVLDEICKQANLSWIEVGNQVILKRAKRVENKTGAGQLSQVVRGQILDQVTQTPLIGVTVQIISTESSKGTITDYKGDFRMNNVPVGRQQLVVSYIGYEAISNSELLVSSGKELVLTLEMKESLNNLDAVIVTNSKDRSASINSMASVSTRSFSTEETSRYAGGIFDPARMVQNFAGVTITDDLSNNIVIRGNSPKSLQWRLEGVEINNPNHFGEEGSSGGGISMISSNMLTKSDFLTSAFPAEYGNALSGVFDLQFRKGNAEKPERSLMIGVLGTEASMEGPFKKGKEASYLFNYRYSTLGILEKMDIYPAGEDATPNYQDLAFNINIPTNKAGAFSVFAIGGNSWQHERAVRDVSAWRETDDKRDTKYLFGSFSGGIKNLYLLGSRGYLKNIVAISYNKVEERSDTLTNDFEPNAFIRDNYINTTIRYSGLLNYKLSSRLIFRTGLVGSWFNYNLKSASYNTSLKKYINYIDKAGGTGLLQTYAQLDFELSPKLVIKPGVHINYFGLSKKGNLEPRLGLNYKISKASMLSFGFGLHSRIEPIALYYAQSERPDGSIIYPNSKLDLTKAAHYVAGYEQKLSRKLKMKFEAYYQKMYDVPISVDEEFAISTLNFENAYAFSNYNFTTLANKGKGENYGLELTVERSLLHGFYCMINSSIYNSLFTNIKKQRFNTIYSGKYSGNLVMGKEYKVSANGKNLLGINFKSVLNGGKRYSPVNIQESINQNKTIIYQDRINTLKLPNYFRIDFAITYRVNRPKVNHFFNLDIQNITKRENALSIYHDYKTNTFQTSHHAGIVPTLNYKIQF